jgi:hypothetical protein
MEFLKSLPVSDSRLDDHVTVYDGGIGEFFSQVELLEHDGDDVLNDKHFYFAWEA